MVQWALAFTVGLFVGFFYPRESPPLPEAPAPHCPAPPPHPKCQADRDLVVAAEMIQAEFNKSMGELHDVEESLSYCRRTTNDLEEQVDDWRHRYYQGQ